MKTSLLEIREGRYYVPVRLETPNELGLTGDHVFPNSVKDYTPLVAVNSTTLRSEGGRTFDLPNYVDSAGKVDRLIEVDYTPGVGLDTLPTGLILKIKGNPVQLVMILASYVEDRDGVKVLCTPVMNLHTAKTMTGYTQVIDSAEATIRSMFVNGDWVQCGLAKNFWNYITTEALHEIETHSSLRQPKKNIDSLATLLEVRPNFTRWSRAVKGRMLNNMTAPYEEVKEANWMIWREYSRWVESDWNIDSRRKSVNVLNNPRISHAITAGHFPSAGKEEGTVSFTKDNDDRARDRRTTMKLGRYIRKFHDDLTDEEIKRLVAAQMGANGCVVQMLKTSEEIVNGYLKGPDSCASYKEGTSKWYEQVPSGQGFHPTMVYGDSDIQMAVAIGARGRIGARTLVNMNNKKFVRIYSSDSVQGAADDLKGFLSQQGFTQSNNALDGAKIKKIELPNGYILCPFLDMGDGSTSRPVAIMHDHLIVQPHGSKEDIVESLPEGAVAWGRPRYSNGTLDVYKIPKLVTCKCCGARKDTDRMLALRTADEFVCKSCVDDNRYVNAAIEVRAGSIKRRELMPASDATEVRTIGAWIANSILPDVMADQNLARDEWRKDIFRQRDMTLVNGVWYFNADVLFFNNQPVHVSQLATAGEYATEVRVAPRGQNYQCHEDLRRAS